MTSLTDDLVDGVSLKIGRTVLTIPALDFKSLRRLRPQMAVLTAMDDKASDITDEQYEAMIEVVHTAIRRNYPNMSRDELEAGMDLGNAKSLLQAVMTGSGMTKSGEARPATS